ncbi:unnamed protein product [Amoebophrya sp. A120]|nr:unnamed protein product [Amoebophrya sp. A120]|eukprot:GSA120T00005627001.1
MGTSEDPARDLAVDENAAHDPAAVTTPPALKTETIIEKKQVLSFAPINRISSASTFRQQLLDIRKDTVRSLALSSDASTAPAGTALQHPQNLQSDRTLSTATAVPTSSPKGASTTVLRRTVGCLCLGVWGLPVAIFIVLTQFFSCGEIDTDEAIIAVAYAAGCILGLLTMPIWGPVLWFLSRSKRKAELQNEVVLRQDTSAASSVGSSIVLQVEETGQKNGNAQVERPRLLTLAKKDGATAGRAPAASAGEAAEEKGQGGGPAKEVSSEGMSGKGNFQSAGEIIKRPDEGRVEPLSGTSLSSFSVSIGTDSVPEVDTTKIDTTGERYRASNPVVFASFLKNGLRAGLKRTTSIIYMPVD